MKEKRKSVHHNEPPSFVLSYDGPFLMIKTKILGGLMVPFAVVDRFETGAAAVSAFGPGLWELTEEQLSQGFRINAAEFLWHWKNLSFSNARAIFKGGEIWS